LTADEITVEQFKVVQFFGAATKPRARILLDLLANDGDRADARLTQDVAYHALVEAGFRFWRELEDQAHDRALQVMLLDQVNHFLSWVFTFLEVGSQRHEGPGVDGHKLPVCPAALKFHPAEAFGIVLFAEVDAFDA